MNDWQSWAAPAVVAITAALFIFRSVRSRRKTGCGGSCGCSQKLNLK